MHQQSFSLADDMLVLNDMLVLWIISMKQLFRMPWRRVLKESRKNLLETWKDYSKYKYKLCVIQTHRIYIYYIYIIRPVYTTSVFIYLINSKLQHFFFVLQTTAHAPQKYNSCFFFFTHSFFFLLTRLSIMSQTIAFIYRLQLILLHHWLYHTIYY